MNNSQRLPATTANLYPREGTFMTLVALCSVHNSEADAALGRSEQWPTQIDWVKVVLRIKAMGPVAESIINDAGDPIQLRVRGQPHVSLSNRPQKDGPRMRCVSWTDFMESVERLGTLAALGLAAQQASFKKEQPG